MTLNLCTSLQNQKRCPETIDRKKRITQSRYRSLSAEQKPTKRSTLIIRQFDVIQLVHRYPVRRNSSSSLFSTSTLRYVETVSFLRSSSFRRFFGGRSSCSFRSKFFSTSVLRSSCFVRPASVGSSVFLLRLFGAVD